MKQRFAKFRSFRSRTDELSYRWILFFLILIVDKLFNIFVELIDYRCVNYWSVVCVEISFKCIAHLFTWCTIYANINIVDSYHSILLKVLSIQCLIVRIPSALGGDILFRLSVRTCSEANSSHIELLPVTDIETLYFTCETGCRSLFFMNEDIDRFENTRIRDGNVSHEISREIIKSWMYF